MHSRVLSLIATGAVVAGLSAGALSGAAVAEDSPPPPAGPPAPVPDPATPIISPTSGPPGTVISVTVPGCSGIVAAALGNDDGDVLAVNEGPGPTITLTVPADAPQGDLF